MIRAVDGHASDKFAERLTYSYSCPRGEVMDAPGGALAGTAAVLQPHLEGLLTLIHGRVSNPKP